MYLTCFRHKALIRTLRLTILNFNFQTNDANALGLNKYLVVFHMSMSPKFFANVIQVLLLLLLLRLRDDV